MSNKLKHEVDALGGEIGKIADCTYLQKRVLNASRGPAVRALRAQTDKREYAAVMQVLAAAPIIRANFLDSQLRPESPEVRLTLNSLNLEEMTRIWNAFNQPYRLSVCYQVQVVSIDSIRLPEDGPAVTEQLVDVHQIVARNGGTL